MQYVIWGLLIVFCLIPVIIAQCILNHDEKCKKKGGKRT